jgi:hypothetical protein
MQREVAKERTETETVAHACRHAAQVGVQLASEGLHLHGNGQEAYGGERTTLLMSRRAPPASSRPAAALASLSHTGSVPTQLQLQVDLTH